MVGIYAPRIHRLGPENATLSVHTKRGGAAAKAGHDLELHVTSWEATFDESSAELTADASSLRVVRGTGGMQALGDDDKDNIRKTIDQDVLQKRNIVFRSTRVDGPHVEGDLTLGDTTRPIAFDLERDDDGRIHARAVVTQTRWGLKPFSALFGTLKVLDDVEVRLQSR
jgi:polyisoprenoid-binding protein YceI